MRRYWPSLVIAVLVAGIAGGTEVVRRNVVSRDGDTMTGALTIDVTDGQNALIIDENDIIVLNGGTNSYTMSAASGTLSLTLGGGSQFVFDQVMSFTRVTGNNAISLATNGARIDLGSGSADYLDSDGTNIQTGGDIDIGGNGIVGTQTDATFAIASDTADSTTSSTVAALTFGTNINIAATDLVARFADSAGTTLLSVNETGDLAQAGSGFFSGSLVTRAWCGWRFQEGQTTTITHGCAAFTETNGAARSANTGDTARYHVNLNTATTDNSTSSILTAVEALFSRNPRFSTSVRTGASITNIRLWAGLTESSLSDDDTPDTIDAAAFRFSTGVPDTNWQCCSSNGTASACTDSGTAVAANTTYKMAIRQVGANWAFYLNDVLACTRDANLPQATANVAAQISVDVITGGAAKALAVGAGALEVP